MPSSNSSLDYRHSDARIVENGLTQNISIDGRGNVAASVVGAGPVGLFTGHMRRRKFISLVGAAAADPSPRAVGAGSPAE
jgi:threonine dehydrogenase-like Zn-dependent dehydrogenase